MGGPTHWPLGVHCLLTEDFRDECVPGRVHLVDPFVRANDGLVDELLVRINVSPKRRR